jgi:hypothetical protein
MVDDKWLFQSTINHQLPVPPSSGMDGFDRATGKERTHRARTNTSAVNDDFGGRDGLYSAVLAEASNRLVTAGSNCPAHPPACLHLICR